jgi:RNA polymerase sigma-70 factor (ECF subfamily)
MQTTSDEVLISRIAGGDRLAMQVLYARHHVRVYRFVLRLVSDGGRLDLDVAGSG